MKKEVLQHFTAWLAFWGLLLLIRGKEEATWSAALGSVGVLVIACTLLSSFNFHLLRRYFEQQHYWQYSLLLMLLVLSVNGLIFYPLDYFQSGQVRFLQTLPNLVINLLLSSGVYFIQSNIRRQYQLQDARSKQLEAEMNLLKMQIQPHFLFNALNNLYAANLLDPEKANEMILQLADLLRYQLEITKRPTVKLEEEIALTEHYIALEKIRLHQAEVTVEKMGDFSNLVITPLLLLPLVENAFKHSAGIGEQKISLQFTQQGYTFTFKAINSVPAHPSKNRSNQLGLDNVKRRLAAFYDQRHQLSIDKNAAFFSLTLTLQLSKQ